MKKILAFLLSLVMIFGATSCIEKKEIPNPTPESLIESFYTAWEKSDAEAIASLTCEPMWDIEAKSADVSVDELKAQLKEAYAQGSGSKVYYKILSINEYKSKDKEYKDTHKWALDRYNIEIEGYAVVRVAVTYDDGEPVTENMELIKFEKSWYAKDLLGI